MTHWIQDKIYVTPRREKSSSKVKMSFVIYCFYLGMFPRQRFAWFLLKLTNKTQSKMRLETERPRILEALEINGHPGSSGL